MTTQGVTVGPLSGGKVVGTWSWPFRSVCCRSNKRVKEWSYTSTSPYLFIRRYLTCTKKNFGFNRWLWISQISLCSLYTRALTSVCRQVWLLLLTAGSLKHPCLPRDWCLRCWDNIMFTCHINTPVMDSGTVHNLLNLTPFYFCSRTYRMLFFFKKYSRCIFNVQFVSCNVACRAESNKSHFFAHEFTHMHCWFSTCG